MGKSLSPVSWLQWGKANISEKENKWRLCENWLMKKTKVKSLFFLLSFYYILWIRVKLQHSLCPIRYFKTPTCECHNSNKCSLKHIHIKILLKIPTLYTCLFHVKSAYLILWSFYDFVYHQIMCLSYSFLWGSASFFSLFQ